MVLMAGISCVVLFWFNAPHRSSSLAPLASTRFLPGRPGSGRRSRSRFARAMRLHNGRRNHPRLQMDPLGYRRYPVLVDDEEQVITGRRQIRLIWNDSLQVAEAAATEGQLYQSLGRIAGVRGGHRMDEVHPLDLVRIRGLDADRAPVMHGFRRLLDERPWAAKQVGWVEQLQPQFVVFTLWVRSRGDNASVGQQQGDAVIDARDNGLRGDAPGVCGGMIDFRI